MTNTTVAQQLNWNQRQRWINNDGTLSVEAQKVINALVRGLDQSPDTFDAPDFQQPFVRPEEPLVPISVDTASGSPLIFVAQRHGSVTISGGTVSDVTFQRLNSADAFGVFNGKIELLQGDSIIITFSIAPTVKFYPT